MIIDNNNHKGKEKIPGICGDYYYCVTSQPQGSFSFANSAALNLAFKITEKTAMDPFFLCDLDAYRSGDLLSVIENGEI